MSEFRKFCIGYWVGTAISGAIINFGSNWQNHSYSDARLCIISIGLSFGALVVAVYGKRR